MARHVCLPEDLNLLSAIKKVVPSWTYTCNTETCNADMAADCLATASRNIKNPHTYDIHSAFLDEPMVGLPTASALCAVLADLLEAHIEESHSKITFHAAAFAIANRLVALTGPRRTGKSTLIARLCAEPDLSIFCDDVLPIAPNGHGIALGLAPRLRLPLPSTASTLFSNYVAAKLGPHDARYGYLCSPNVAAHGTSLPLQSIVVLSRQAGAPARLHHMHEDEALYYALEQNMGHFDSPEEALSYTQKLLGQLCCVKLIYSDLEEAVALLKKAFACPTDVHPLVQVQAPLPWDPPALEVSPVEHDQILSRAPGSVIRRIGQSAFLWRTDDNTLWRLNTVAEAIWNLLEIPGSATELAEVLAEVYLEAPRAQLEQDIAKLMGLMLEEGFCVVL